MMFSSQDFKRSLRALRAIELKLWQGGHPDKSATASRIRSQLENLLDSLQPPAPEPEPPEILAGKTLDAIQSRRIAAAVVNGMTRPAEFAQHADALAHVGRLLARKKRCRLLRTGGKWVVEEVAA